MNLPIWPTISISFIIISAICVAIGWFLIRKGNMNAHKKTMITAAVFAVLFFIVYLSRTIIVGNTPFGGPEEVKIYYTIFLLFHIVLATTGGILGIYLLITGFKKQFKKHKRLGPFTSICWFITAITGTLVYLLLYVWYPTGETTNVFRAIFNF